MKKRPKPTAWYELQAVQRNLDALRKALDDAEKKVQAILCRIEHRVRREHDS